MNVNQIAVDKDQADETLAAYEQKKGAVPEYSGIDAAIIKALRAAVRHDAKLINVRQSVEAAGVGEDGFPRLAIVRADAEYCHCVKDYGSAETVIFRMGANHRQIWRNNAPRQIERFRLPNQKTKSNNARAIVPIIPIEHRPKYKLSNYHILFEAIWEPIPPIDPILLRRVHGDLFIVLAEWDLTDLERAVLGAAR